MPFDPAISPVTGHLFVGNHDNYVRVYVHPQTTYPVHGTGTFTVVYDDGSLGQVHMEVKVLSPKGGDFLMNSNRFYDETAPEGRQYCGYFEINDVK